MTASAMEEEGSDDEVEEIVLRATVKPSSGCYITCTALLNASAFPFSFAGLYLIYGCQGMFHAFLDVVSALILVHRVCEQCQYPFHAAARNHEASLQLKNHV